MIYIQHEQHGILPTENFTQPQKDAGWEKIDIDEYLGNKIKASAELRAELLKSQENKKVESERKTVFDALSHKWANDKESMTRNELFSLAKFLELDPSVSSTKKDLTGMIESYEASITD